MQEELKRISSNHHALLNALQQMVLLISNDGIVEYMNPRASLFLCNTDAYNKESNRLDGTTSKILLDLVSSFPENNSFGTFETGTIRDAHVEFSVSPFTGYRGDNIHWLIIRDLTEKKKNQDELAQYRNNLETILSIKINELKESERVRKGLANQLVMIENHLKHHASQGEMVGSSTALHDIRDLIFQIDKSDATVLITGESGTGKELVANLIQETSERKNKPFLKLNCNAINDSLLESELFGYERGAFTGATKRQIGKFEAADGGTLFLDEIGDISPQMQSALLRVLQNGEFMRVGGNKPIKVNVRVIAATNTDLQKQVRDGSFRLDLFYRLNIIHMPIPPLRERKEDISDLVNHFLRRFHKTYGKKIEAIPQNVKQRILDYDWPGNIRELENVIQRAVLVSKSDIITVNDLIFENACLYEPPSSLNSMIEKSNGSSYKDIVAEIEKEVLTYKLQRLRGNVVKAAEELQISKTGLYDKLKRYGINAKDLR